MKTHDLKKWQQVIDVNLTGTFLGIQAVIDPMTEAKGGSIINISSIEGLRGAAWVHGYVASKWAVRGLTKLAALELAPLNIRVNSIHPGFIRTPMTKHLPDDMVKAPLGRPGKPEEVSTFVLFLASDESSFSTAAEFVMDGGLVADVPHKEFYGMFGCCADVPSVRICTPTPGVAYETAQSRQGLSARLPCGGSPMASARRRPRRPRPRPCG